MAVGDKEALRGVIIIIVVLLSLIALISKLCFYDTKEAVVKDVEGSYVLVVDEDGYEWLVVAEGLEENQKVELEVFKQRDWSLKETQITDIKPIN